MYIDVVNVCPTHLQRIQRIHNVCLTRGTCVKLTGSVSVRVLGLSYIKVGTNEQIITCFMSCIGYNHHGRPRERLRREYQIASLRHQQPRFGVGTVCSPQLELRLSPGPKKLQLPAWIQLRMHWSSCLTGGH